MGVWQEWQEWKWKIAHRRRVYRLAVILVICVMGRSYLRVVDCLFYVGAVFKYNFGILDCPESWATTLHRTLYQKNDMMQAIVSGVMTLGSMTRISAALLKALWVICPIPLIPLIPAISMLCHNYVTLYLLQLSVPIWENDTCLSIQLLSDSGAREYDWWGWSCLIKLSSWFFWWDI